MMIMACMNCLGMLLIALMNNTRKQEQNRRVLQYAAIYKVSTRQLANERPLGSVIPFLYYSQFKPTLSTPDSVFFCGQRASSSWVRMPIWLRS